jgi:hypothetical protein
MLQYITVHLKVVLLYLSDKQLQRIWRELKDKNTSLNLDQGIRYPNQATVYNDGIKYNIDRGYDCYSRKGRISLCLKRMDEEDFQTYCRILLELLKIFTKILNLVY